MLLKAVTIRAATWLRANAERYLMVAAEADIAKRYGHRGPSRPKDLIGLFFVTVFVPVYRAIPWKIRTVLITAMPGSHRKTWTPRDRHTGTPAV